MSTAANPVTLEHVRLLMLASTSWTLFWRLKVSKGCKSVSFGCALTPVRMCALVNLLTKSSWTTRNQRGCMLGKKTLAETQHRCSKFHEGCLVPGCRSFSRTLKLSSTLQHVKLHSTNRHNLPSSASSQLSHFDFITFKNTLNADSRRRNSHLGNTSVLAFKKNCDAAWTSVLHRRSKDLTCQRQNLWRRCCGVHLLDAVLPDQIPFFPPICWVTQCKLRCINKFHALTSSTITAGNNCKHWATGTLNLISRCQNRIYSSRRHVKASLPPSRDTFIPHILRG